MTTQVTISADEACKLLNIHRATLYEKARAGEIPGAKIGRWWVFIEVDLIHKQFFIHTVSVKSTT